MSKTLLIVIVVALCSLHAWSQTLPVRVKGRITDKESQQPLADATVALLYARDSTRAVSGFTDKEGTFVLEAVKAGDYNLYVTYLGYQPVLQAVTVTASDTLVDLGVIPIQGTGVNLKTVEIVRVRAPMVVKKDTLEFNAEYYKTRENAVIEELLKKLPGVQIDPDGTIKVNGEPVKRILVDGKPFFGDDPKLATQNLPADMIDKIQLIDKKSEQAEFSGVEDGKREKAINITVKKDRKGSFFGKAAAGYGTEGRFAASGNLNRFSNGEQLAFLGGTNNVNNASFLDGLGKGLGIGDNGITRNWNGGVNYSRDLNQELMVSGSYVLNNNRTENVRNSARQNLLPDTTYYYNQDIYSVNSNANYMFNLRAEYKPDSMQTFVFLTGLNYTTSNNFQDNIYESLDHNQQLVNNGIVNNTNASNALNLSAAFFWGKRFNKPGRTFTTSIGIGYNNNDQEGFNKSHNLFVQPNGDTYADTINQRIDISNQQRAIAMYFIYTEPVFKDRFLEFKYAYNVEQALPEKKTYDYNSYKNEYDYLNDSLSNSFENVSSLHQLGASIRTQKKRYDYSIGLNIQFSGMNNKNISQHSSEKQRTINPAPIASFNYAFTRNNHFRFNYAGNTFQPDVTQLQPVPDNSNPLYIQLGNPELEPGFVHNFNMVYHALNPETLYSLTANINAAIFTNKIINANWFDSLGRQVSQPLNVNGIYNLNGSINNSFPLKKLRTAINASTEIAFNRDVAYMNGIKGNVNNLGIIQQLSFNYTHKELFDFAVVASISYNGVRYSLQKDNNTNYFNYTFSFNGNANLPAGFIIGANLDYMLNTGRTAGYNLDAVMLNAFISKSLFKHRRGLLKLQCFDLLKQNVSISRNVGQSYIEDVQTSVLKQFFMLSFSYFLKPAGGDR